MKVRDAQFELNAASQTAAPNLAAAALGIEMPPNQRVPRHARFMSESMVLASPASIGRACRVLGSALP